jgi:hypothetical protein
MCVVMILLVKDTILGLAWKRVKKQWEKRRLLSRLVRRFTCGLGALISF